MLSSLLTKMGLKNDNRVELQQTIQKYSKIIQEMKQYEVSGFRENTPYVASATIVYQDVQFALILSPSVITLEAITNNQREMVVMYNAFRDKEIHWNCSNAKLEKISKEFFENFPAIVWEHCDKEIVKR